MTDRGPDSAGIAIHGAPVPGKVRITVQSADPATDFAGLKAALHNALQHGITVSVKDPHAVILLDAALAEEARAALASLRSGLPKDVVFRFGIDAMGGTHGIGHTRMATESAVTTLGAHPVSTGADQCVVHNGSLSNHNNLRRELKKAGMRFATENDSEVAAAYLTTEMAKSADLDGVFTFVVGTKSGFGVLRDSIACKPAVMTETGQYVAFASEHRALTGLPGIEDARVWEPEPATVYFWDHGQAA